MKYEFRKDKFWKYFIIAIILQFIIILSTSGILEWFAIPKWVIMFLRAISCIILSYFVAHWIFIKTRQAEGKDA